MMLKKNLRLIVLVCSLLTVVCANAQVHTSVVLQHGDNATAFYGDSALIKAHDAAQSGDAIYLSIGSFVMPTVTKAVKIYGNGQSSVITNKFNINIPSNDPGFHLEGVAGNGIYFTSGVDLTIKRSSFNYPLEGKGKTEKLHIVQCVLNSTFYINYLENLVVENSCVNSYIRFLNNSATNFQIFPYIKNSYVGTIDKLPQASFCNSIVRAKSGSDKYPAVSYTNCVLGFSSYDPDAVLNCTELTATEIDALFKDQNTKELTDEAATKYLGDDQTQVGIYGGTAPYTLIPSTPVITRASHPSTPTADGKLPFEITVELRD